VTTDLATYANDLDDATRRVVTEMAGFDDFPVPFLRDFARDLDMPVAECRRIVLALQKDGVVGFGPIRSPEGLGTGSSYFLNHLGVRLRELVTGKVEA
jgi:DNA-binding Lrp family transcriptional regulator